MRSCPIWTVPASPFSPSIPNKIVSVSGRTSLQWTRLGPPAERSTSSPLGDLGVGQRHPAQTPGVANRLEGRRPGSCAGAGSRSGLICRTGQRRRAARPHDEDDCPRASPAPMRTPKGSRRSSDRFGLPDGPSPGERHSASRHSGPGAAADSCNPHRRQRCITPFGAPSRPGIRLVLGWGEAPARAPADRSSR